jgi:hypothetical protein
VLKFETGTNKGMFLYFLSLVCRNVTIHTFDSDPRCRRAVDLVNQAQRNVAAVFHEGDTRQTLRELNVGHYLPTELARIPRSGFDLYLLLRLEDGGP